MKRPLLMYAISAVLGVACSNVFGSMSLAVAFMGIAAAAFCWKRNRQLVVRVTAAGMAVMFTAGAVMLLWKQEGLSKYFDGFYGQEAEIKGIILSEPVVRESYITFIVGVDEIRQENTITRSDGKVSMTMQKDQYSPVPAYGDEITVTGELSKPKGVRNPEGFNYRGYLARQGVSAVCYAQEGTEYLNSSKAGNPLIEIGLALNKQVVSGVYAVMPAQQAGLLCGLLTGYREGLSKEVLDAFGEAGLLHLVAVSGMQVGLIITVFLWIFRKAGVGPRMSNCLVVVFLLLYMAVTGFTASIIRASIMGTAILAGGVLRRETDALSSISLAAIVMLLYNPYYLFDAGFQLSFCATLSILLLYRHIKTSLGKLPLPGILIDITAVTLSAQIGVLPVSAYHFNSVSLISLAANILVVPLISVVTILGLFTVITVQINILLAYVPSLINCGLLSVILAATRACAELPAATVNVPTPNAAVIIFYYVLVLLWAWKKSGRPVKFVRAGRVISALLVITIMISYYVFPLELEAYFLDVGQGDSILIRTPAGKTVLVDGGGETRSGTGSNMGETVVLPLLIDLGIRHIDIIIATHAHDDHIKGLVPVLTEIDTELLMIPDSNQESEMAPVIKAAHDKGTEVTAVARGDEIKLDGKTTLRILHPDSGTYIDKSPLNNGSVVLKLMYGDISMLLTGDIEAEGEEMLLESGEDIRADLLKVPHHGSDTSSTDSFLTEVSAQAAIISVGRNNFGHPSPDTIERLDEHSVNLLRTDRDGAVIVKTNGKHIKIAKTAD